MSRHTAPAPPARTPLRAAGRLCLVLACSCLPPWAANAEAPPASPHRLESIAAVRALAEWREYADPGIAVTATATLVDEERNLIVLQAGDKAVGFIPDSPVPPSATGLTVRIEAEAAWPRSPELPAFPHQPDRRELRSSFETESTEAEIFFVARFRGLLHPPSTGRYRFAIASDDSSLLLLGTGPDPATRRIIASMRGYTREREWSRTPGQRSEEIFLEAGKSYYIEAIHHQNMGPAHLSVAWEGPDGRQAVIPGVALSPWSPVANPNEDGADARDRTPAKGMILREVWADRSIEDPQVLASPRPLDSILMLRRATIAIVGPGQPPPPAKWSAGRPYTSSEDLLRCTAEGTVELVSRTSTGLILELTEDAETLQAIVPRWTGTLPSELRGRRVRITGVGEATWSSSGQRRLGKVWLHSLGDVLPLAQPLDYESAPLTPLAELTARTRGAAVGSPVLVLGRVAAKNATELVLQDTGTFRGYVSANGTDWELVAEPVELPMADTVLAGLATNSRSPTATARAVFSGFRGAALPLTLGDVGAPTGAGRLATDADSLTIEGVGNAIGDAPDQFSFAHAPLTGKGSFVTRLQSFDSTQPDARAGLMIRESLAPDAQYVGVFQVVEHGRTTVRLQWRQSADGRTTRVLPDAARDQPAPVWLRLDRYFNSVVIRPRSPAEFTVGDIVEAVGVPDRTGANLILADAWVRRSERSLIAPHRHWRPLVEVARLNGSGPRPRFDVYRFRGVVTFCGSVAGHQYLAIQDSSGGTFVRNRTPSPVFSPPAGSYVEVHSNPGWSIPSEDTVIDSVLPLGQASMPPPVRHPAEYLLPRRGEGTWIAIEGVLRAALADELAEFKADGEILRVALPGMLRADLARLTNARVRLRGVIAYPSEREALLLVPSTEHLETIAPAPADPFAQPPEMAQAFTAEAVRHRARQFARISGVVTSSHQTVAYLQDDTGGVRLEFAEPVTLPLGATVEAIGFPDWGDNERVVFRHARWRIGASPLPNPAPQEFDPGTLEEAAGRSPLARLRATLLRLEPYAGGVALELETGGRLGRALLPSQQRMDDTIPPGSTLELTGILTRAPAAGRVEAASSTATAPQSAVLLLRSPADVVVLRKPPWWVVKRTLLAAGGLALAALLALAWIHVLRRRVRQRTAERDATLARLEREVRTSATFAERDRLAGEIHDGIAQGLNAIMIQLETTAKRPACPPEVRDGLLLARNMAAFSRTEVQHALWGLQSPLLEDSELPVALQKLLGRIVPETIRTGVDVSGDPRRFPSATEHHLLRIVQEAVNNAVKHGAPQAVTVALRYEPGRLVLEVADDGCGFVADRPAATGHFGLRSLHNRAAKIGGIIRIESAPGRGTLVRLELPASRD